MSGTVAVLDVGGSAIKSARVTALGACLDLRTEVIDRDADAGALLDLMAEVLARHLGASDRPATAVVVAFPGPFDYGSARPRQPHKFAALDGVDLREAIGARLRQHPPLPISFVNDAEAAAVGESLMGAGAGRRRMLMIALGTGLGAAFTHRSRIVRSVGAITVGDLYRMPVGDARADDVFSARGLAHRLGVAQHDLGDAVRSGRHMGILERFGEELGTFLDPIARRLDADIVVIGGGAGAAATEFGSGLDRYLGVRWRAAQLGRRAALIGAAEMQDPDVKPWA